jgi:indolepyruvate ferredoxin oxidoreductase
MDMTSFNDWAEGLDLIVVVEEKRKLIEVQIKEAIFDDRKGRRVYGWFKGGAGACTRRSCSRRAWRSTP